MNIETCVNTSNEVLFNNVYVNSRRNLKWVKQLPEHEGHAVIVGGGPSLKDWIREIKWRQSIGQTVFALNNTVNLLLKNDIVPDHQIILDARESNLDFIHNEVHKYLASQCHPFLFEGSQDVTLWHQEYPDDMEEFDKNLGSYTEEYSLIGGGTTVGLSAMALVYVLGYRKIHLYGYDSSFRNDDLHAYKQDDPARIVCDITAAGKKFKSTLSMAQQAELFPTLSDKLLDLGCILTIRGDGLLPHISKMSAIPSGRTEQEKYEKMWELPVYREVSPGEDCLYLFLKIAKPEGKIIDFGCGTGRAALKLSQSGLDVLLIDITSNSRDEEAKSLNFVQWDLKHELNIRSDYGYCTDVMEHVPPEDVEKVIKNIMYSASKVFFQISLVPDSCGKLIGEHLHLSVHSYDWWIKLFEKLGYKVSWSKDNGDSALFYISTT